MDFYQSLAPYYDEMTNFSGRLKNEKKILSNLLDKYPAKKILDAGCGSGLHSIAFSKLGRQVTGFDPSKEMIQLAQTNAKTHKVSVQFVQTDFINFKNLIREKFDGLFCLGNSFVHLLTFKDQKKALENFKKCVNKKGKVCVQILNYDKILKEMKTQVSLKKTEKRTFHRFYTFNEKTVTFNLVIQSKKDNYKLKTELYPLKSGEFISICENVGFGKVDLYGDLQLNPFSKEDSENMVAFCLV